jgi:hypothetical protein
VPLGFMARYSDVLTLPNACPPLATEQAEKWKIKNDLP